MMPTTNDPTNEIAEHSSVDVSDQPCRLPEDVVHDIFVRLPVKTLIRFRCVSKGMYGIIDSSDFIKNHNIRRSKSELLDEDYAIFLHQTGNRRLFSVNFDKEDDNLNRANVIEVNSTLSKEDMFRDGWCCNGIFCFKKGYGFQSSYVFWNPSNGTFRKVAGSSCSVAENLFFSNGSLGYDHVNDDYKIIRVSKSEPILEIYSFRKDSWRKLRGDFVFRPVDHSEVVCLSGVMHWLSNNCPERWLFFIVAFDLATEAFTSVPIPLEARELKLIPSNFANLGGRLCITFFPSSNGGALTVWVMEKYGVQSSWTKLYSFDDHNPGLNMCSYFPNRRRRLLCHFRRMSCGFGCGSQDNTVRCLSWWDPQDDAFEEIEFTGPSYDKSILSRPYIYVRNLVRLDQSWEPC